MRYDNPELTDKLASRYVLGVLKGHARRRFERLLKFKPNLRRDVALWQERLAPLTDLTPPITPPRRVWRAIETRLDARSKAGARSGLRLWQSLAGLGSVAALVFAILAFDPARAPVSTVTDIAVLADAKAKPTLVVSWSQTRALAGPQLRVQLLTRPADLAGDRTLELWMLPGGTAAPVSLGVIATQETQTLTINENARRMLPTISALAVSVEPVGGSKTGLPTGPVIASGPSIKV